MPINLDADIIICGGGHAGLTAALALAGNNLRIRIIEEHPFQPITALGDYDLRVSAITPVSVNIFRVLKVWPNIKSLRISPFREIQVWEKAAAPELHFDSAEISQSVLGYIIENSVIQTALFNQLKQKEEIIYDSPVMITSLDVLKDHVLVNLSDGRELTARLVIGADGARSRIRNLIGFTMHYWDYPQHALVATIKTTYSHSAIARQRFLPTGPLAFLPLKDPHVCSIVWSHTQADAERLATIPSKEFIHELDQAFEHRLGHTELLSKRLTFPLRLQHAHHYVHPRIALIGDAAHTIHPLAGQGLNLGLLDAIALAEVIVTAQQQQRDIGLLYTLRRYERWRKGANIAMLGAVDLLQRIFGIQAFPVQQLRQFGLKMTEACYPAKQWIMERAMGFSSDLPKLINQPLQPLQDE